MEQGKYYKVTDGNFHMIGQCLAKPYGSMSTCSLISWNEPTPGKEVPYTSNGSPVKATTNWCFKNSDSRTYRLATQDEINKLERSLSADRFIYDIEIQYEIY